MTPVFADTGYWIALSSQSDHLHVVAVSAAQQIGKRSVITSEMILTEFLDGAATQGHLRREAAWQFVEKLQQANTVRVVPQTPELFAAALAMYKQRPDKEWSLTDCASFVICQQEGIVEVLAQDHHFQQAGFVTLLRS